MLAPALLMPAPARVLASASASTSAEPARMPLGEEERPVQEERGAESANPLSSERWRPQHLARVRVGKVPRLGAPVRGGGRGRARRVGRHWAAGRGPVELRCSVPPPFHDWVRSQTW